MKHTITLKNINILLFLISVSLNISAQWTEYKELSSHPSYYTIPFKTECRKVSFADKLIYVKIEESQIRKVLVKSNMGNYYKDRENVDINFVPLMFLNNNWMCYSGRLFKVENNIARGILNNNRDSLYQARDYEFSHQLVLDENGYIIDILKDKLCATQSCGELKVLRNKYSLGSYKIPELPYMPALPKSINSDLPYWASNPTYIDLLDMKPVYNDSLIFLIVPVGGTPFQDLPINKPLGNEYTLDYISKLWSNFSQYYHHEEKYGYNYFFKKYNLSSVYSFEPKNIACPKNDACLILEFNYIKNKLNFIYDSGILPMFPKKITFDQTGRLLIVSNFDFVDDNAHEHNNKKHESIIVFDLKNKRELFEIPGRFIDVTPDNKLILNGNVDEATFEKNNYRYSVPSAIFYDELDLKEIIENIENFEVPSINKSLNIDEFTTTEEFFNTLKEMQKKNISNSQFKFQSKVNYAAPVLTKSNPIYNSADFLHSIAQEETKLCNCFSSKLNALPDSIEVPFTYEAYDLNNQTITFKFNDVILNKLGEPYESLVYMLWCNGWIETCQENSKSIRWDVSGRSDNATFTVRNITPEMGRSLKNNCKLVVKINKKNELQADQLGRYSHNPILMECLGELYNKNTEEIENLLGKRISSDHISVFKIYLKIGNENILIKSR